MFALNDSAGRTIQWECYNQWLDITTIQKLDAIILLLVFPSSQLTFRLLTNVQCSIGTTCTFKTYGECLPEESLMLHDMLTPLLFKREELRSIATSKEAKKKESSRVTIASSPLYADAVKRYYGQLFRDLKPLTPPSTDSRAQPAPFPCPSPIRSSPSTPSAPSEDEGNLAVDFIDLSDDHEDVLFWAIVWIANNLKYKSVLLSPKVNEAGRFTLSSLKLEMGEIEVEQTQRLETYDPAAEIWRHVPWHTEVGPLNYNGQVILLRYAGVTRLEGFDRVKSMARRLPGSKGKHQ